MAVVNTPKWTVEHTDERPDPLPLELWIDNHVNEWTVIDPNVEELRAAYGNQTVTGYWARGVFEYPEYKKALGAHFIDSTTLFRYYTKFGDAVIDEETGKVTVTKLDRQTWCKFTPMRHMRST